ncbi:MAG: hypothetical protein IIB02_07895 [Thaumarchaeota archaeon]|nr:hypothetical protein [Nitrososphaerota archaeon]
MNKTKKGGIVLIVTILALVISPGVALSEAYATNNSYDKIVRIAGLDDVSFVSNTINITKGDTIVFINVDGTNGGVAHSIVSVQTGTTLPDGIFDSGLIKIGQSFKVSFDEYGIYEYIDSMYPSIRGIIHVM